jgi:hypothetical protein
VYTGIHNEQEEGKDHGKDKHSTGGYEQSKHIKHCDHHLTVVHRLLRLRVFSKLSDQVFCVALLSAAFIALLAAW